MRMGFLSAACTIGLGFVLACDAAVAGFGLTADEAPFAATALAGAALAGFAVTVACAASFPAALLAGS